MSLFWGLALRNIKEQEQEKKAVPLTGYDKFIEYPPNPGGKLWISSMKLSGKPYYGTHIGHT